MILLLLLSIASIGNSWPHGQTKVRGVNIGSWLVLEKWITPSVFRGVPENINDEYKLTKYLGYKAAEQRLRAHWDTWFTVTDVIRLKKSGINYLRIPIGYWAFDIQAGEPWVRGSWEYIIRACGWAKQYGLQVMVDLHGAPGSQVSSICQLVKELRKTCILLSFFCQNGNDHSGQSGAINFFNNDENLSRAVKVVGQIAMFANSTQWRNTISIIQILNEPILWQDYNYRLKRLKDYYRRAYDEVRRHK